MNPEKKFFVEGPDISRVEVRLNDRGEDFNPQEKGSIPNHDKLEIIYDKVKTIFESEKD